jgi:alkylation response protein AidB-like acyl-CoA dehydrogenase/predicted NBD/HSP70 family sugar kinase
LFDDVHEQFRAAFATFVEREMVPDRDRWESSGIVDRQLFTAAGSNGFLGIDVPEELGGGGVSDFRFNVVIAEELQRADVNAAGLGITLHNDICMPYFLHEANDEQRRRWLPGICSGELITAVAMTEPGIGSDLVSMSTTAVRDGEHYVVNGSKTFITNGVNADLVITAVKTDPAERHRGMSLLVVERDTPGFERGRNLDKIGMHAQDTAELFFADARVPVANRLGDEGTGFVQLVSNLPQERLSIAVTAVAAARAAFDRTLEYAKSRTAFGQQIGTFQNIRFRCAERARPQRRRVHRRRGGDGQMVVHRAARPRRRHLRPDPRRLRVHDRVSDRPGVHRRPHHPHLRRHDRDHEGDHRPLSWVVERVPVKPRLQRRVVEVDTIAEFTAAAAAGDESMDGRRVRGLDLRGRTAEPPDDGSPRRSPSSTTSRRPRRSSKRQTGAPSVPSVSTGQDISFGIDIGGSGMKAAPVDPSTGTLTAERFKILTPKPATPEAMADVVRQLVEHFSWDGNVGAAFPAVVRNGVARTAANIDHSWIGTDVDAVFTAASGRPVHVINDADAAGLAEMRYGVGRGRDGVVIMLTFGTGIGSGLFVDGKLVPNTELGHLLLDGHQAEHLAAAVIRDREKLSWKEWGQRVNRYLQHVVFLFSPDLLILGGGISRKAEKWLGYVDVDTEIAVASRENEAGIVGAASIAELATVC